MTYYQLLGVSPTASFDEIRHAYRAAVRRFHPDVNRAANASQVTAALNEAWGTLADGRKRAAYDRAIARPAPTVHPPTWRPPPPSYGEAYGPSPGPRYGRGNYSYQPPPPGPAAYQSFAGESPVMRVAMGGAGVFVALAFVASVLHWFPLIATVGIGIIIARSCRSRLR